jgi:hypothetical protein
MNPLIQFKTTPPLLITIALLFVCFGILPKVQAVVPPPDGGYPNFTTAEGQKALLISRPVLRIQQWGGFRSLATQAAASTPPLARGRSFSTPQTTIRRLARRRSYSTPPASTIPLLERPPFLHNTIAEENTATGAFALSFNTTGVRNTAMGDSALFSNTTGNRNTATGNAALVVNTTGDRNTTTGAVRSL